MIWSPNALGFVIGELVPPTGTLWHLLASLAVATFAQRVKDKPFTGRGKTGPSVDDKGTVQVAAK